MQISIHQGKAQILWGDWGAIKVAIVSNWLFNMCRNGAPMWGPEVADSRTASRVGGILEGWMVMGIQCRQFAHPRKGFYAMKVASVSKRCSKCARMGP